LKPNQATIIFSVVLGVVCALVLTSVAKWIEPLRMANEQAELYRNVLNIFDIEIPAEADNKKVVQLFNEQIRIIGDPENPDYYLHPVTGANGVKQNLLAVPAKGPGLWGPIHGLIGLAADGKTITAVSFYKQEETPGLGGEIAGKNFTNRFKGKMLFGPEGQPALKLTPPGKSAGDYEVDAVSGATMTSDKVQTIITETANKFKQARQKENR